AVRAARPDRPRAAGRPRAALRARGRRRHGGGRRRGGVARRIARAPGPALLLPRHDRPGGAAPPAPPGPRARRPSPPRGGPRPAPPPGTIEVRAADPDPFGADQLALIALIADTCATALERASRIERLVFVDPLTGAYNRPYFDLQMNNEMKRAERESASM